MKRLDLNFLCTINHFKFFLVAVTCCSKHYEKATEEFSKSHQKTINIGPILCTIDCITWLIFVSWVRRLQCIIALWGLSTTTWTEFCHFWTCVESFYTLSMDKKRHFLTPSLSSCPRCYWMAPIHIHGFFKWMLYLRQLRSVNLEMSFCCHRFDKNVVRISALKFFVASWGFLEAFWGFL